MSYHANYFKLSRAIDCFLSLRFYGALTWKSAVIFLSFPLNVNVSKEHHDHIVANRYFLTENFQHSALKNTLQKCDPFCCGKFGVKSILSSIF